MEVKVICEPRDENAFASPGKCSVSINGEDITNKVTALIIQLKPGSRPNIAMSFDPDRLEFVELDRKEKENE